MTRFLISTLLLIPAVVARFSSRRQPGRVISPRARNATRVTGPPVQF